MKILLPFTKTATSSLALLLSSILGITACTVDTKNSNAIGTTAPLSEKVTKSRENKPNIVILYVDDLGYGDVGVYGAKGVKTPNVDALAAQGIRFTDAHASSATCTPSRYSLLTGEYAFRQKAAVLQGDAALIIKPNKPTLANLVKKAGYKSAVIGKWHLGLGNGIDPVNWNQEVKPGPMEVGFDYSFILPATADRVPAVYLENHHVINLDENDPLSISYVKKIGNRPTGYEHPELLRQQANYQHNKTIINGVSRIGWMKGGKKAEWKDEDFYQLFTQKAQHFMDENKDNPFLLFFSFSDIHVPRLPNERFQGLSSMGVRGDSIAQMDWITGNIVNHLEKLGILDNTLIVFTSDNGPVLDDGYADQSPQLLGEHKPGGIYRGGKYSAFEAGTRVPTIVYYPKKVAPGVSNALMTQVDLYASIASLLNLPLNGQEAIDSQNMLPAWLNHNVEGRSELIEESYTLSLRHNNWKYIAPTQKLNPWVKKEKNIEAGLSKQAQLYNLMEDPNEALNIADQHPEIVEQLSTRLEAHKKRVNRL